MKTVVLYALHYTIYLYAYGCKYYIIFKSKEEYYTSIRIVVHPDVEK